MLTGTVAFKPLGPVKVTVPVGVPDPGGDAVTVADKITVSPFTDGFGNTLTTVCEAAAFTVRLAVPVETS
ncbi:hypothetical protein D3C80_2086300 [compost metagenome]